MSRRSGRRRFTLLAVQCCLARLWYCPMLSGSSAARYGCGPWPVRKLRGVFAVVFIMIGRRLVVQNASVVL